MHKKKPNRKYSFEGMKSRIQKAESVEELVMLSNLLDDLFNADMLTANKYCDLDSLLDERWSYLLGKERT